MILGLDPGTTQSALVAIDHRSVMTCHVTLENEALRRMLSEMTPTPCDVLVIEQITAMGMAVGAEVFETVFWSGRFAEAWRGRFERLKRVPIKVHLCGSAKAKDANIRAALIDRYGGKAATKKGGSLYGIKGDEWSALAVGITFMDSFSAIEARA